MTNSPEASTVSRALGVAGPTYSITPSLMPRLARRRPAGRISVPPATKTSRSDMWAPVRVAEAEESDCVAVGDGRVLVVAQVDALELVGQGPGAHVERRVGAVQDAVG